MKNSPLQFLFALLVLLTGTGLEETLPKFLGVGFPFLLVAVQFFASSRPLPVALTFACAAGGLEDAISSLPIATSVSYFAAVTLLVHWAEFPRMLTSVTYPLFQVWLAIWVGGLCGDIFLRMLLAIVIGALTGCVWGIVMAWCERKAAIDVAG